MKLEFHIPRPPSVNNLFVNAKKGGGRIRGKGYKDWTTRAGLALNTQINGWKMLTGPVKVAVSFNKRKGDIDNYLKPCLDLLERHRVFGNDKQVVSLQAYHDPECGDLMFVHVEAA